MTDPTTKAKAVDALRIAAQHLGTTAKNRSKIDIDRAANAIVLNRTAARIRKDIAGAEAVANPETNFRMEPWLQQLSTNTKKEILKPYTNLSGSVPQGLWLHRAVRNHDYRAVALMIRMPEFDVNAYYPAFEQSQTVLIYLIRHSRMDAHPTLHLRPEALESWKKTLAVLLSSPHIDVNLGNNGDGDTALHFAVDSRRYIDGLLALLRHPNIDVNVRTMYGNVTPLMHAVEICKHEYVEPLLAHPDVDINARDAAGFTALMYMFLRPGNWVWRSDVVSITQAFLRHPRIDLGVKTNGRLTVHDVIQRRKLLVLEHRPELRIHIFFEAAALVDTVVHPNTGQVLGRHTPRGKIVSAFLKRVNKPCDPVCTTEKVCNFATGKCVNANGELGTFIKTLKK